ncbi:unnamed protein product, partial [Adineta steineri]
MAKSADRSKDDTYKTPWFTRKQISFLLPVQHFDDNRLHCVAVSSEKFDELRLPPNRIVLLGNETNRRQAVCIVESQLSETNGIQINHMVRNNLNVFLDHFVSIKNCGPIRNGDSTYVAPIQDTEGW